MKQINLIIGANYMVVMIAATIFLVETQNKARIIGAALLAFDDLCLYCNNEA